MDPKSDYSNALFLINEVPEGLVITSGNYLLNTEIRSLENRIDLINSLTNDEIAQFYRGLLDIGTMSRQGGAGLGFVDIAKKTGSKIQYQFKPVNDRYSFYIFKILISK